MKMLGLLLFSAVLAAVLSSTGSFADASSLSRNQVKRLVIIEATNSDVPPALALAVAKVESDFQGNALSHAGARGVIQIMPKTARTEFGVGEEELWDERTNIQLGIDFLSRLYKQYGRRWDLALSHYNGGTLKGKGRRAVPHSYTKDYVRSVLAWQKRYEDQATVWEFKPDRTWAAAGKEAEDRWIPARTRASNLDLARVQQDRPFEIAAIYDEDAKKLDDGWQRNFTRRRLGKLHHRVADRGRLRVRGSWKRPRYPRNNWSTKFGSSRREKTDESFSDRLRKAHEGLDDFGPVIRDRET